jgi:caffeoyl-CoA O-methyltransferase
MRLQGQMPNAKESRCYAPSFLCIHQWHNNLLYSLSSQAKFGNKLSLLVNNEELYKKNNMEFLDPALDEYVVSHSEVEPACLHELNRKTHLQVMQPRMLSGHFQGRLLSMLSHMIKPKRVLEIGTYTGYSAICFAEGLVEGGKVITIDVNEELEEMVTEYIGKCGMEGRIENIIGDAAEIIPVLDEEFDIVFIDADKKNYCLYYDLVFDKVKKGGYIIADNVLWSGKVLLADDELDRETLVIKEYNRKIHADDRVQEVLLPVRDGLMIARKK